MDGCWERVIHEVLRNFRSWNRACRADLKEQRSGLTVLIWGAPDMVTRSSLLAGRWDQASITKHIVKGQTNKHLVYTTVRRTKGWCCNISTAWSRQINDKNRRLSTVRSKRSNCFFEGKYFKSGEGEGEGGRAGYQDPGQLHGVSNTDVLNSVDGDLTQTHFPRQEQTSISRESRPTSQKEVMTVLEANSSKLRAGLSKKLSISFYGPNMDTIGNPIQARG